MLRIAANMSWLPKFGGTGVPSTPTPGGVGGSPSGDDSNKDKAKGYWSY